MASFGSEKSWKRVQSVGLEERDIRGLIGLGVPLPIILNTICDAIDFQISSVISLIVLCDKEEYDLDRRPQNAGKCGLHTFCWAAILSQTEALLGILQMHCCDARTPTADEVRIIDQMTHLAAIAIESRNRGSDQDTRIQNIGIGQRLSGKISFLN